MKPLHWVGSFLAVFVLAGCANQPLQHNYEGDVYLRWLEVNFEPLQLYDKEMSGAFAKITPIEIEKLENKILSNQQITKVQR